MALMRSAHDDVARAGFTSANLTDARLTSTVGHNGDGLIHTARLAGPAALSFASWIDYTEVPPGTTIGTHRHADDEEEFYLVLSGTGLMQREQSKFPLRAGDLVRNPPGGVHGLHNDSAEVLRLFVFCCGPTGRS